MAHCLYALRCSKNCGKTAVVPIPFFNSAARAPNVPRPSAGLSSLPPQDDIVSATCPAASIPILTFQKSRQDAAQQELESIKNTMTTEADRFIGVVSIHTLCFISPVPTLSKCRPSTHLNRIPANLGQIYFVRILHKGDWIWKPGCFFSAWRMLSFRSLIVSAVSILGNLRLNGDVLVRYWDDPEVRPLAVEPLQENSRCPITTGVFTMLKMPVVCEMLYFNRPRTAKIRNCHESK